MINSKKSYNQFGLAERDIDFIFATLSSYDAVETALIFGSRAKGMYKKGSDIDLALTGSKLNSEIIKAIAVRLNEQLPIPFFVDVVDYTHLKKEELKNHIDAVGKRIYERKKNGSSFK